MCWFGVRYVAMSFFCWTKSLIRQVTLLEFHTVHLKVQAKMLAAIDWAIKELLFLSFLCRLFAIELYGVTGGLMLCECDRKQMRCALTAPLHHCWTANVRSQTAYVQDDRREERGVWAMFYGFESVYVSVICLWVRQMCTCSTIWIACWNSQQVIQAAGTFE